jgi:hypothetical protein
MIDELHNETALTATALPRCTHLLRKPDGTCTTSERELAVAPPRRSPNRAALKASIFKRSFREFAVKFWPVMTGVPYMRSSRIVNAETAAS